MKVRMRAIVLDRIEPGETPPYCIHGRSTCMGGCNEWVWLGSETAKLVQSGQAVPLCRECATRLVAPTSTLVRNISDHMRIDGPHNDGPVPGG